MIVNDETTTLLWILDLVLARMSRYGRDIKTVQIYNRRPIILYRFYKDPIKYQGSWTLFTDLGPCFGMNGHSRRAMDVILRLSKSTTDFLSFYIGFGSLSKVKMVVFDEQMTCV